MEQIKFSVIIPMYNIEDYIEKCIESILNQKYDNYEIIVVNDGSKDKSEEKVLSIKSDKIKIINKKNGGLSSARNEGLKHVTGDYIWFIDGDDYIEENAFLLLNDYLSKRDCDVISFRYYKDYLKYKTIQTDNIDIKDKKQYPLINTSACTKIFKSDFYIKNNFEFSEGKIYEDLSLIPFVMSMAKEVGFIEEPLYNYVYRENSIMNSKKEFKENRDDKFYAMDRLYSLYTSCGLNEEYSEELEYLTIKHLLLVYSTEILIFKSNIYNLRCKNVLKYLKNINPKWYKNKYLKASSILTRIYVYMFKMKMFYLCKMALKFKKF